jgi:hypothetical protein
MKKRIFFILSRALIIMSVFVLSGCPQVDETFSGDTQIAGFSVAGTAGIIDHNAKTITIKVPYTAGFSPSSIVPEIVLPEGASINPLPGTASNFLKPLQYTITAENGSTDTYTVTLWPLFSGAENLGNAEEAGETSVFAYLGTLDYNEKDEPYYIAIEGINLESEAAGTWLYNDYSLGWTPKDDGIKKLLESFNGRFAAVDLSGCTGTFIKDTVVEVTANLDPFNASHGAPRVILSNMLVSIILPDTLTDTGTYTFTRCPSLVSVKLPANLVKIGNSAFAYCTDLKTVTFPPSLREFGSSAFSGSAIETVDLTGVTTIGMSAFSSSAIKNLVIPASVTSIGASAFSGLRSLESADVSACTVLTSSFSFSNSKITTIKLPDNFPSNEGTVGRLFYLCKLLKTADLSNTSITKFQDGVAGNTFGGCTALETVKLPATVTEIGNTFFYDISGTVPAADKLCSSLKTLVLLSTTPPEIKPQDASAPDTIFGNTADGFPPNLTIYVPDASLSAYESAVSWAPYVNLLRPLSELPQ